MPIPEELARQNIDQQRMACSWITTSRWPRLPCRGLAGRGFASDACKSDDLLFVRNQAACERASRPDFLAPEQGRADP